MSSLGTRLVKNYPDTFNNKGIMRTVGTLAYKIAAPVCPSDIL